MTDEEIMIEGLELVQSEYQRKINFTFNPGVSLAKGGVVHGLKTQQALDGWRAIIKRAGEIISELEDKNG